MRRWSVEAQVLAGFSLTVAMVLIVGASLYRTTIGFIDTSGAALRSQQALVALEGVFSLLSQAESQQRIYLLLGQAVDLAPRHEAVARMNSLMAELDELTNDDPTLHARVPALRQHVAERMAMLEAVLTARQGGGFEAGQRQLATSPGREEMQRVRTMVASMQTELGTRLRQRQHDAQQNAQRTLVMLGLLLLFVAAALAALYARIRRESRERRNSEERLRAVVDTAADGIITIDANGSIQSFNPAAERLFGHAADEVMGRNVSLLMPEPHRSGHDGYLQRYLESGEPHVIGVGREVTAQRKDGSPIAVGLAVSEMQLGARRLFTGILHDLTEAKRAEQRQTQLIHDLQNVNEELKSFAYVVSHDLKAPLRGVGSLADWLMTDYADRLDDQGREYLSLVKGRVSRMDALIDGILEYSRVGRINDTQTAIDLNVLVSDIIQLLAPPAGVTVTVDGPLPTLFGGRTRLQQVFQNLISNAIKHLDKPVGRIRVACTDLGDAWQFSVADNGPGIEARHFERIFQLFQVLTPRDQKESTGVGLALVKKIVELHGGRVWLESRVGEGSTFFFTLPKMGAPQHCRRANTMKSPSKPILLVEDDQVDTMTVRRALKELKVTNRLECVENGEAALAYLHDTANERPCLILLDLNMPVMGGIEFLRVVKGDGLDLKRIPVVVLTTSEEQQDKVESFNMGVAGYIRKPVDYQRFVETMRAIDAYWTVSEMPE